MKTRVDIISRLLPDPMAAALELFSFFITEPEDHGVEIRCYIQDPDGHLIEVGQSTGILDKE